MSAVAGHAHQLQDDRDYSTGHPEALEQHLRADVPVRGATVKLRISTKVYLLLKDGEDEVGYELEGLSQSVVKRSKLLTNIIDYYLILLVIN